MKKDNLLGMEVYYEDNPQPPKPKVEVWAFGDSSEEDDFENDDFDLDLDDDEIASMESSETAWGELDEKPCVPVKGRIYRVKGLNLVARLKHIRPLTATAGILEMEKHGHRFYIDPSDLARATSFEVESYLED